MTNWARRWLVWYGTNLVRYVACILAVVAALLMLAVIGLRPGDGEPPGAYAGAVLAINLFFLFSVTIYLVLFGVLGRWGWPRLTAVLLISVLWSVSPFLATLGTAIPVAAMWIALVVFAAIVEPPGTSQEMTVAVDPGDAIGAQPPAGDGRDGGRGDPGRSRG